MRVLLLSAFLLLQACAATSQDAMRQAQKASFWTPSGKALEIESMPKLRSEQNCAVGKIQWCSTRVGVRSCECVREQVVDAWAEHTLRGNRLRGNGLRGNRNPRNHN